MIKFFCCFLVVFSIFNANASEEIKGIESDKKVEVFVKKIEKNIVELPTCKDKKLLEKTKEFITSYYEENIADNVLDKRRKFFVLKNIENFEEESVANYKTENKKPVSDIIASLLMNENILEENLRLCKNMSPNKEASKVFVLIYPNEDLKDSFKVNILNLLTKRRRKNDEVVFIYEK